MNQKKQSEIFSKKFLVILLTVSVLTNIILITKQRYPNILNRIQVAMLPAPELLPGDHVRGNATAKYTIIEYADFQCPFCSRFHETMGQLMKKGDVRWVYRHFPLENHPFAEKAAEAAECAGEQGKFWEYADALFALKERMTDETFFQLSKQLQLDGLAFGVCLNTGKYSHVVADQRNDGLQKKIQGTPTFYLNGKRFDGFVPLDDLMKITGSGK